jgi:nitrous oxidase accessory protein NosD
MSNVGDGRHFRAKGIDMKRSLKRTLVILSWLMLVWGAGPAYAAGPAPADGSPPSGSGPQTVLQTPLFGIGEVDLSALGVNSTELLTVGPRLAPLSSNSDGMLIVDDDGLDCPNRQYPTIQLAVDAANPGDKIKVCPGLYMEQVTIPATKDGLTLFAEGALQPVIKAPPVMLGPKAIVRVSGARDVTISHFTITGPAAPGSCNSIRYGVFVDEGGSALITDNHITEIHDTPSAGCQNGLGVAVGRQVAPDGPTTGTATVVHNLIDKYQKGGVLIDNVGSSAEVAYNEVVGAGPTPVIAQNGIQVSRRADGNVHHNKVSQNFYSPATVEASGVLLFDDPDARVHHNDVFLNQTGIGMFFVDATAEVSYNNSRNNFDGIVAYDPSSNNLIAYNKAFENSDLDCRDDNVPTTNQWLKDLGRIENQPGLCKQAGPK